MNLIPRKEQETMSSSQLAEMLGYEKKEVNRKIKSMFQEKIDGGVISPSLDGRGYIIEYFLPELESKMFVAKWNIEYLEQITKFWIEHKNQNQPKLPSNKELALMVIQAEEEKEAAMLEVDRLQGVCNTITAQFATGVTTTAFCDLWCTPFYVIIMEYSNRWNYYGRFLFKRMLYL